MTETQESDELDQILLTFYRDMDKRLRYPDLQDEFTEAKNKLLAWRNKSIAQARHKDGEDYKDRLEKAIAAAQTNGVVWAISLLDELHISSEGGDTTDQLFKVLKKTICDCYKAEAGIDPTPFMDNYDRIALVSAKRREKQRDSL